MFQLEDVRVSFGTRLALETRSLSFPAGSTTALMGPNGSGKTTLLRVLAGLQEPSSGHIRGSRRRSVAYVGQHQHQNSWMPLTAAEVLRMGRYRNLGLLRPFRRTDRIAITAAADRLDIADLMNRTFGELSGGERQRVLIASALANNADCLLLDEPFTGLDLPSQHIISEVMKSERDRGRLVVISTHHVEEAQHCDRVLLLNGSIIADGPLETILTESNLTQAFGARSLTIPPPIGQSSAPRIIVVDDHAHGHETE
jgi:zinc/manganese transport system ATP-binding protein